MGESLISQKRQAANKNPFEPSSDAEDEGGTKNTLPYHLRGNQSCLKIPPLVFQPMRVSDHSSTNEEHLPTHKRPYLYEMLFALWVQSWTSFAASIKSGTQVKGGDNTVPTWP